MAYKDIFMNEFWLGIIICSSLACLALIVGGSIISDNLKDCRVTLTDDTKSIETGCSPSNGALLCNKGKRFSLYAIKEWECK